MKKIIFGLIFSIFCFNTESIAKNYYNFSEGDKVENILFFGKKSNIKIPLPKGRWEIVAINTKRTKNTGTKIHEVALFQFKDNTYKSVAVIKVSERIRDGKWNVPKWCKRENVYFIKSKISVDNYNCWYVNHFRTSMSHKAKGIDKKIIKYLVEKRIKIPEIAVYSQHSSVRKSKGVWIFMQYFTNPELEGMEPPIGLTWSSSEYQKTKIFNYPKKEKFMKDYVKRSAQWQIEFEKLNNFKAKRRIDTSEFNKNESKSNKQNYSFKDKLKDKANKLLTDVIILSEIIQMVK